MAKKHMRTLLRNLPFTQGSKGNINSIKTSITQAFCNCHVYSSSQVDKQGGLEYTDQICEYLQAEGE